MKKEEEKTKEQEPVISTELQAKIDAWQKEFGGVHFVGADGKQAILRKPDRKIVAMCRSLGEDEVSITELFLDACWLEGDEEIRNDDTIFLALMPRIQQILELKEVTIKKL